MHVKLGLWKALHFLLRKQWVTQSQPGIIQDKAELYAIFTTRLFPLRLEYLSLVNII